MRMHIVQTAQLGDLVAAVFDTAAQYSKDPAEVSRLATSAVTHLLRSARRTTMASSASTLFPKTAEV